MCVGMRSAIRALAWRVLHVEGVCVLTVCLDSLSFSTWSVVVVVVVVVWILLRGCCLHPLWPCQWIDGSVFWKGCGYMASLRLSVQQDVGPKCENGRSWCHSMIPPPTPPLDPPIHVRRKQCPIALIHTFPRCASVNVWDCDETGSRRGRTHQRGNAILWLMRREDVLLAALLRQRAHTYTYTNIPTLSIYTIFYFFYIVGGVDVQVNTMNRGWTWEQDDVWDAHTLHPKEEMLRSSLGVAERRLKSNHARERHVTHVCARTAARVLYTRMHARAQACVTHVKHMCPPNPHTAPFHYRAVLETWRNTSLIHMHLLLQSCCKRRENTLVALLISWRQERVRACTQHLATSKWRGYAWIKGRLYNGENWVSMSLADTVLVKRGARDGALGSFKTAVVFSHRRFGILGLDESSGARPGETASAWGAQAVGVATVFPISVFFGLTHRWEGQHFLRRRISHSFFCHNVFCLVEFLSLTFMSKKAGMRGAEFEV